MPAPNYLPPRFLQAVGLILLLAFAVFWAVTGRESVLLVGAAGSLILLGGYEKARVAMLGMAPQPPPQPPVPPPSNGNAPTEQ